MSQVASNKDDGNLQAMRREAAFHMHIELASGRVITGDEAVAYTSMYAGRMLDGDTDEDPGDLCDDNGRRIREPMVVKRRRLAERAAKFAKLPKPNRHWWERHKHH